MPACWPRIARSRHHGADNRSEVGAHYDLFRQRDSNLRASLNGCLPAGISVSISYVS
jgi:hypothetical protein